MARFLIIATLALLIGLISYQNISFFSEYKNSKKEFSDFKAQLDDLKFSNEKLEADIQYYRDENNLEKEARSQLNYKDPGEKLIIVVPKE